MAVNKLFRVYVRQRVNWSVVDDTTVPEATTYTPPETEGASIERDITAFVKSYKLPKTRDTLSSEATVTFISPEGILHPENHRSEFNFDPRDGSTFAPLLAEGNEIQIYRIPDEASLADTSKWISRFRGVIRTISSTTDGGHDSLEVVAGDILSRCSKATVTGSFSPVVRTSSIIPGMSFFTYATMQAAVPLFRAYSTTTYVTPTYDTTATQGTTGALSAEQLARLLYWDREDIYYAQGVDLWHHPRMNKDFTGESGKVYEPPTNAWLKMAQFTSKWLLTGGMGFGFIYKIADSSGIGAWSNFNNYATWESWVMYHYKHDEYAYGKTYAQLHYRNANYMPVTQTTAECIFGVNGHAWFHTAGTVTQDTTRKYLTTTGSLKLVDATLKYAMDGMPCYIPSMLRMYYRIEDASSITIKVRAKLLSWTTHTLSDTLDAADPIVNVTLTGPTTFDISEIGGTLLNTPGTGTYEFRLMEEELGGVVYPVFSTSDYRLLYEVEITTTGTVWIDDPRWDFSMVVRNSETGAAEWLSTNIRSLRSMERWETEDGIVYMDPHPGHRSLMAKSLRVIRRNLRAPYPSGTIDGYGPQNLKNRYLPEKYLYETELVEGQDYETLPDKGGISLSSAYTRSEIYVAHGYYDLLSSDHMEASQMLKYLLVDCAGIPEAQVSLEATGVILSRIELGARTTTVVAEAIKEVLKQLPSNYHIYADGNANVYGHYIQQDGSPRIFSPLIQAPITPLDTTIMASGREHWYAATNLMPDGKETLASNLMSTVEYQNYYDAAHESIVSPNACTAIQMKMAPNAVGLVLRRARAYKTASDLTSTYATGAKYKWTFEDGALFTDTVNSIDFTYDSTAFMRTAVVELNVES